MSNISKNKKWLEKRRFPGASGPHVTGFCSNGHCEGDKPKNYRGLPMKTCPFYLECACSCHEALDKLYESMELPRILVENSEYVRDRGTFIMPTHEELLEQRRAREAAQGKESVASADTSAVLSGSAFQPTESGRRTRNQLEYQVLITCLALGYPNSDIFPITPKWVAEYIAEHHKIQPPSTGAIQAVWDRWVKYKFATYGKGPVRFTGFIDQDGNTPEVAPDIDALDIARAKFTREEKLNEKTKRRVTIRGSRTK